MSVNMINFNLKSVLQFAVLLIYLPSCLDQEIAKWLCGLRIKLPCITTSLTTQRWKQCS